MSEYIIGAGAVLTAGDNAKITPAALHAEVGFGLAAIAKAVAIDFEGTSEARLQRIVVVGQGWNRSAFQREVTAPLAQSRECSLADVFVALAEATGEKEVHLFAHWMPAAETLQALGARGIGLVVHPVEAIERAALVEERCFRRWQGSRLTRVA